MDVQLWEEVEKIFREKRYCDQKILADEAYHYAMAVSFVLISKDDKSLKKSEMEKNKIIPLAWMAGLWGMHTYFMYLAKSGGYVSPADYASEDKVQKAAQKANMQLTKKMQIEADAEEALDKFTELMWPVVKESKIKTKAKTCKKVLEACLRWGWEFGREVSKN